MAPNVENAVVERLAAEVAALRVADTAAARPRRVP